MTTCQHVEPGLDGIGDGLGPVDVRGGRQSRAVGFPDHGPQGGQVVLGLVRLAAGGLGSPLTMTLTTSQPRSARWRTAARKAAWPSASPPRNSSAPRRS